VERIADEAVRNFIALANCVGADIQLSDRLGFGNVVEAIRSWKSYRVGGLTVLAEESLISRVSVFQFVQNNGDSQNEIESWNAVFINLAAYTSKAHPASIAVDPFSNGSHEPEYTYAVNDHGRFLPPRRIPSSSTYLVGYTLNS
jgi:hypothetical protein